MAVTTKLPDLSICLPLAQTLHTWLRCMWKSSPGYDFYNQHSSAEYFWSHGHLIAGLSSTLATFFSKVFSLATCRCLAWNQINCIRWDLVGNIVHSKLLSDRVQKCRPLIIFTHICKSIKYMLDQNTAFMVHSMKCRRKIFQGDSRTDFEPLDCSSLSSTFFFNQFINGR